MLRIDSAPYMKVGRIAGMPPLLGSMSSLPTSSSPEGKYEDYFLSKVSVGLSTCPMRNVPKFSDLVIKL